MTYTIVAFCVFLLSMIGLIASLLVMGILELVNRRDLIRGGLTKFYKFCAWSLLGSIIFFFLTNGGG